MRFLANGPDIPDELIRAQLSGEVLFVVGAGVSRRVGLPLFDGLTRLVYESIGQAAPNMPNTLADIAEKEAWGLDQWDRILGLLEKRIVYASPNLPELANPIRASVAEILRPKSRNLNPYKDILAISMDGMGRSRVVTTNFDTLFERAARRLGTSKPAVSQDLDCLLSVRPNSTA
jgi:NAD-dependent SIR2 family protein deacetylase